MATGIVAALLLVAAPFIPADESAVTGAVLCGFALGWAMVAALSVRVTDQPQRWAVAPALFLGVGGVLLLIFGSTIQDVLGWVWPPALVVLVIWMVVRARRQLRSSSRRLLLYPVVAMLALSSIGGGYETVGEAADAKAYPMPGRLIDVGGHRLHLHRHGQSHGRARTRRRRDLLRSRVASARARPRHARLCLRPNRPGWSEPADPPQDAAQIATDLHTLLHRGNVPGPYVLADHSFGGLYALTFADHYPDEVDGMVLVDSTAPAPPATIPTPGDACCHAVMSRVAILLSTSGRLGLSRVAGLTDYATLPPHSRDEARAHAATSHQVRSTIEEYIQGGASVQEAASLRDFGD